MVAAIGGAANAFQFAASNVSRTGTQAELANVRKEYSACLNCASASTTEGKAKIQALELRLRELQAKVEGVAPSVSLLAQPSSTAAGSSSSVDLYA